MPNTEIVSRKESILASLLLDLVKKNDFAQIKKLTCTHIDIIKNILRSNKHFTNQLFTEAQENIKSHLHHIQEPYELGTIIEAYIEPEAHHPQLFSIQSKLITQADGSIGYTATSCKGEQPAIFLTPHQIRQANPHLTGYQITKEQVCEGLSLEKHIPYIMRAYDKVMHECAEQRKEPGELTEILIATHCSEALLQELMTAWEGIISQWPSRLKPTINVHPWLEQKHLFLLTLNQQNIRTLCGVVHKTNALIQRHKKGKEYLSLTNKKQATSQEPVKIMKCKEGTFNTQKNHINTLFYSNKHLAQDFKDSSVRLYGVEKKPNFLCLLFSSYIHDAIYQLQSILNHHDYEAITAKEKGKDTDNKMHLQLIVKKEDLASSSYTENLTKIFEQYTSVFTKTQASR